MKNKVITSIIVIFIVAVSLFILSSKKNQLIKHYPQFSKSVTTENTVSEIVSANNQEKKFNNIKMISGKTALDLLSQTTTVQTKGEGGNAYVTEINNIKADDAKKEYWAFYINNKLAEVGAGSYQLKNGDLIKWQIEHY